MHHAITEKMQPICHYEKSKLATLQKFGHTPKIENPIMLHPTPHPILNKTKVHEAWFLVLSCTYHSDDLRAPGNELGFFSLVVNFCRHAR